MEVLRTAGLFVGFLLLTYFMLSNGGNSRHAPRPFRIAAAVVAAFLVAFIF